MNTINIPQTSLDLYFIFILPKKRVQIKLSKSAYDNFTVILNIIIFNIFSVNVLLLYLFLS